jgi:hypothetical protein
MAEPENGRAEEIIDAVLEIWDGTHATAASPSIQWYPKDWFADERVAGMSFAAKALHFDLIQRSWMTESSPVGSIDNDPAKVRREIGGREYLPNRYMDHAAIAAQTAEWSELWTEATSGWVLHRGRLWQIGLCKAYLSMIAKRKTDSDKGKRAAQARWGGDASGISENASGIVKNAPRIETVAGRKQNHAVRTILDASSSSSSSSSSIAEKTEEKGEERRQGVAQKRLPPAKPARPEPPPEPPGFDELWKTYPGGKRGDRRAMAELFRQITCAPTTAAEAKRAKAPPVDPEVVLAGVRQWYENKWRSLSAEDFKFEVGLERWMNERRWEDPPIPRRGKMSAELPSPANHANIGNLIRTVNLK